MNRYENASDAELAALTQGGDADAFEQIVLRCQRLVFAAVREIVSDAFAVEDIAQDTFVFAFLNIDKLREWDKLRSWLIGIAKRKALHYVGRRQRFEDIESAEGETSQDDDPELRFLRREKNSEIRDAVLSLPEKLRQAALMFYFHDMKVSDIARSLSVAQGTVVRRLHDARAKLKERLGYMIESIENTNPAEFAAEVKKRLTEIQTYYIENGGELDDRFHKMYSDAEEYIKTASDENEKKSALADLYTFWGLSEEEMNEGQRLAKESGNGSVIADQMVDELFDIHDTNEQLRILDEEMIPEMDRIGSSEGKGKLLFWRTHVLLYLRRPLEEIEQTFAEAARLIPPENALQACAVCGLRTVAFMRENSSDPYLGFSAQSQQYRVSGDKLLFILEPGFNLGLVARSSHTWDAITYCASCFENMFYDMSMKPGDIKTTDNGDTFLLVSNGEAVSVPAGVFANCMHTSVRFAYNGGFSPFHPDAVDVWYADGVGIAKAVFSSDSHSETYELSEYEIKGGKGPFPLAAGNAWRYVNPGLPEYTASLYEWYVTWTDGVSANLSVAKTVTKKKNFDEERDADGEYFIKKCTGLCGGGSADVQKVEEGIEALRAAVRKNTSERDTQTALGGIEYLERMSEYMKKYRLCVSRFLTFLWSKKDGRVTEGEWYYNLGPYRWGTHHIEDCLFGTEPYRYQSSFFGCIWDDKWVAGYHEEDTEFQHPYGRGVDYRLTFDVGDGGTVTVGAGTFENCLKLTIRYGTLDDVPTSDFNGTGGDVFGVKEYRLARGVGIVRFDCDFGRGMKTSLRLTSYKNPAHEDGYFPLAIGCEWEYDEETLTSHGYCAKIRTKVLCGHGGKFMLSEAQEFFYRGSNEEYDAFIAELNKNREYVYD